jgi:hypothetical protein
MTEYPMPNFCRPCWAARAVRAARVEPRGRRATGGCGSGLGIRPPPPVRIAQRATEAARWRLVPAVFGSVCLVPLSSESSLSRFAAERGEFEEERGELLPPAGRGLM